MAGNLLGEQLFVEFLGGTTRNAREHRRMKRIAGQG